MITAEMILYELESSLYNEVSATYNERVALACTHALFECLYLNFNKSPMYIPTSDKAILLTKYEAIWRDFTGSNHVELSIKYHLSFQQIYTITNKMREQYINKIQADIFLESKPKIEDSKPFMLVVFDEYLPPEFLKYGVSECDAMKFSKKIADFLLKNYSGISVLISKHLKKNRANKAQIDCFNL